jgi:tRNA(fMet)-specific endonuclease VapC
MNYLLDTNICIYLIKRQPPQVLARFQQRVPGDIGISTVSLAELEYGAAKSRFPERNRQALEQFILPLLICNFNADAAAAYGLLRTQLERAGMPIGPLDLMIAAHALSLNVTLVTHNIREFERVAGLRVETWV